MHHRLRRDPYPGGSSTASQINNLHKKQEPPRGAALVRVIRGFPLLLLYLQLNVGMLTLGTLHGVSIDASHVKL